MGLKKFLFYLVVLFLLSINFMLQNSIKTYNKPVQSNSTLASDIEVNYIDSFYVSGSYVELRKAFNLKPDSEIFADLTWVFPISSKQDIDKIKDIGCCVPEYNYNFGDTYIISYGYKLSKIKCYFNVESYTDHNAKYRENKAAAYYYVPEYDESNYYKDTIFLYSIENIKLPLVSPDIMSNWYIGICEKEDFEKFRHNLQ